MMRAKRKRLAGHGSSGCRFESLEDRRLLAGYPLIDRSIGPYTITAPTNVLTPFANGFTNLFKQAGSTTTPVYTGSDGIYSIPLNGINKLGSAYSTPGWQMYTTGDSFIGSYNTLTGLRNNGTKFVNNTAAIHLTSGQSPTATTNKWRGSYAVTPGEAMAIVSRPTTAPTNFYWPEAGVVVNGQLVQLALRQGSGSLETLGVSVFTAPVDSTFNTTTDWPYNGSENSTWFNSDNRTGLGSARNVFLADTSTTNAYNGPRAMGAALLDTSDTQRAFKSDGYIYSYGVQNGSGLFQKYAFIARATPADYANTANWQFWSQLPGEASGSWRGNGSGTDAIGWGTGIKDAAGNFVTDMASEFSVTQMPDGRLAMLYSQNDFIGGGKLAVRYAAAGHPEGPWSAPTIVYTIQTPTSGNASIGLRAMPSQWSSENWFYGTYGAKIHPQLSSAPSRSTPGKLLVSFHVISLDGSPGSGTQVLGPDFSYGDIYRPRFIELSLLTSETAKAEEPVERPAVSGDLSATMRLSAIELIDVLHDEQDIASIVADAAVEL